jgi:hypothetical protein
VYLRTHMGPRDVLAILPVLAGLTWGSTVRAADVEESFLVEYRAPAGCPTAQSFIDQLRRRGIHAPIAAPGERARTFEIEVRLDARAHGQIGRAHV